MASTTTNWVYDKGVVTEKDKNALLKAKRLEEKEIAKGYKWVEANARTKVLVECDEKGNPTEEGRKRLERMKAII